MMENSDKTWSTGEGNGKLFQHSGLENSMDCIVHGVTNSWTRLSDFHFLPTTQEMTLHMDTTKWSISKSD